MLARSHFQQKLQMQPSLENMKNIKRKRKHEKYAYSVRFLKLVSINPGILSLPSKFALNSKRHEKIVCFFNGNTLAYFLADFVA